MCWGQGVVQPLRTKRHAPSTYSTPLPLSLPLSFTTSLQLQHAAETGNSLSSEEVTMIQTQLVVLAALGAKGDGVTALVGEIKNASKRNRAAKLGMNWVRSEG